MQNVVTKYVLYQVQKDIKQAGADITGQLQVRPMLYTLYIGINLTMYIGPYTAIHSHDVSM